MSDLLIRDMEALRESVKEWLYSSFGDGSGCCYGRSFGCGYGYGDGSGYGDDCCSGNGSGDGSGYGSAPGNRNGYGHDFGYGYGFGDGSGTGCGANFGTGVKSFAGEDVYMIDGVPTIIRKIRFGAAFGAILNSDLTLTRCWVAKGDFVNGFNPQNEFAHGATLKEARKALVEKMFNDMSVGERIAAFWKEHNRTDKYNGRDLWKWHHRLTGSCEMGRNQFCADRGIDIDKTEWTVDEFIALCKDNFGGRIIKRLEE